MAAWKPRMEPPRARDREAAFEAGCSLYLLKPPDLADLKAALDGAVAVRLEKHG
jgi:CheY-like chemotaxis protein